QSGHAADTRVQPLRDALDHAAFSGCIAAFEHDHHPVLGVHDPVLKFHQLALEPEELTEVERAASATLLAAVAGGFLVFQLKLELLIKGVEDFVIDAMKLLALFGGWSVAHRGAPFRISDDPARPD